MIDLYPQKSSTFLKSVRSADRQSIAITDLISEGPVYGLVDGQASVYLNDDRVAPLSSAPVRASTGPMSVTLTNGSTTATITGNVVDNPLLAAEYGDKYLIVRGGNGTTTVTAAVTTNGVADGNNSTPITTSSNFFTNVMRTAPSEKGSLEDFVPARLVPKAGNGTTVDGEEEEGIITTVASGTSATFVAGDDGPGGVWLPDEDSYDIVLDKIVKIASISGTTITLSSNWDAATGSYKFDVSGATVQTAVDEIDQTKISKYKGVTTQFRVGTLSQTAFSGEGGIGSTSISNSPSAGGSIEWTTGFGGSQAPKELLGSSSSGFNLTASQLKEVDEARITFAYGAHYAISGKGNDKTTYTRYKIQLALKAVGAADFDTPITIDDNKIHAGMYKNSVTWVENIDLTRYRPFADFKVIISRKTNHEGPAYKTPTETYHDWTQVTSASISQTTCVIKEILTHPYSAMAKVTFGTDQFQSMPSRTYHTRGLKVLVPSNYITREETGGAATYNRNTSTGAIEATYQDWDGAFRSSKVYTNNPAWVFYDILLNNRYGLGDFLKDTDIDKFSLYRIARYCDELVPDGKGGQEPRFTANLYLTKQADAFKVLKDMATTFRSMVYYLDGQVVPVIDAPKGPVYNFTKANVIEGAFAYEGTGSKTRINQVIVSWMNPDANYALEPLIVEDRIDIAKNDGVIISQNSVAFGATSEGQATRYGRWKLWTAANQKEVVKFSSSLNASFLVPGDIINVQDSDRHSVRYGGRISNTGVNRTTMGFPLDSSVTLNSGSTYTVSVIFVKPVAFAMEDIYTTAATPVLVYNKGDIVEQGFIDHDNNGSFTLQNIDSEDDSLNAKLTATASSPMSLNWADYTRVETRNVSTTVGNTVNDLSVSAAFTEVPDAEAIWVLTETKDGLEVSSSSKEYKIISLSESSKNVTDISAVEHYDEKFDAVDVDFTTFVADTVFPPVVANDEVPPPTDVYSVSALDPSSTGEELTIHWTPPAAVGTASDVYEFIKGYEISHNFPLVESPQTFMNKDLNAWKVRGITDGSYKIAVRTINTLDNLSNPEVVDVTVLDRFRENVPRMPDGVPYSGTTSIGVGISSDSFIFKRYQYAARSPSTNGRLIQNTNSTSTAWQQSCTNLPTITWTEASRNSEGEFIKEHAYILLDESDSTDRLKLISFHNPTTSTGTPFWYNIGSGNITDRFGSALTGTFSKLANSSKVTGSGTAFTTEIVAGDVLKLGTEEIRVAAVSSNTVLYLTRATTTGHSNVAGKVQNIRIDYANDVIIARVYKTSAGLNFESYIKIDANLKPAGDIIEAGGISSNEVAADAIQGVHVADDTLTAAHIVAGSITADEIATNTLTANEIATNTLTANEIATNTLTANEIAANTLTANEIAANAITASEISADAVTTDKLAAGAVTADEIAADAITTPKLAAGAVTADEIGANAITTVKLAAGAVTADEIGANAITAAKISAGAVTASEIAAGAITAGKIAADAVTATEIDVSNLSALNANLGNVTAGTLKGGNIPEANTAPSTGEAGAFIDLTAGKMVLGNPSKYIWWDGSDLEINGVTLSNSTLTNSTGFASETFVNTAISNLIDSAPGTLDTLNELAAALGDDPNFAASVTTNLAGKVGTSSAQALGSASNVMTISGHTITLARADGSTDTVTVPDSDTVYTHPNYTTRSINTTGAEVLDVFTSDSIGSVTNITKRTMTLGDLGYTGATNANRITDNSQIANGRGFTTNTGTTTASNTQTFTNKSGNISQWTNDSGYVTSSGNTVIGTDSDIDTSAAQVLDTLVMTDGVITSHSLRTLTLANLGYTGATNANNFVLPFTDNSSNWNTAYSWGDHSLAGYVTSSGNTIIGTDSDIDTSGATVIDQLNMTDGVIQSHTTRTMTLGDLGYTGATNANRITNNTEITNGRGFTTNTGTTTADNTQTFTNKSGNISQWTNDSNYLTSADGGNASTLGGIAASNYITNTDIASSSAVGVIKLGYSDNGKNYAVELSSNRAYVNVPWENTVYTHPTYTARSINTSGATVIDVFTSDSIGSVTNITTRTLALSDLTSNAGNWDTAYNNHITGVAVTGSTTKTITLTQNDGGTITANWADASGSNDFVDSISFNNANGILTVGRTGSLSDLTTSLDGRYVTSSGNTVIGTDSDIDTSGAQVLDTLVMTDGVITSHSLRTLTLANLGYTGATNANNFTYTHPSHPGDDINIDTTALTGATVISDLDFNITTDTQGHVTDANGTVATRNLTLGDLGYTGATNANNYVHPSHPGDDISIDTTALTGATVISDLDFNITTDTQGHVTDANGTVATRNLTLGDLGYTGATNATANAGTVTSVVAGQGLTGGTITSSGTIALSTNMNTLAVSVDSLAANKIDVGVLDADAVISRDIRVGASGSEALVGIPTAVTTWSDGELFIITSLGNTSNTVWSNIAGTPTSSSSDGYIFYAVGDIIVVDDESYASGTGTGRKLTGQGAHLNTAGDFLLGKTSTKNFLFFDNTTGELLLSSEKVNGVSIVEGENKSIGIGINTSVTPTNKSVLFGFGSNGNGYGNTSIGAQSGSNISDSGVSGGSGQNAAENTSLGLSAGYSLSTGSNNVFLGSYVARTQAGATAIPKTGDRNIGIGGHSATADVLGGTTTFSRLSSGSNNIALGSRAAQNLSTGDSNIFVGTSSGYSMTTGSNNVIIGMFSGNAGGYDIRTSSNNLVLSDGAGNIKLKFDTSANATFTGNVEIEGTSGLTTPKTTVTDGTRLLELQVFSGYNQISSMASSSGSAQELRFTQGLSGTQLAIRYNQIQAHESLLLDGATTTAASTANIISATSDDGNGTTQYHIVFTKSNASTALGRITTNNFGTTYTTSSDYRLKENVQAVSGATNKVLSLNPVNFQWKDSTVTQDGFLAHEVAEVVPEAVVGEKDGAEMQSIDQSKLVPLLVKTIQELEARITALENP